MSILLVCVDVHLCDEAAVLNSSPLLSFYLSKDIVPTAAVATIVCICGIEKARNGQ